MVRLSKLFESIYLGSLRLPNRIIMPGVTTYYDRISIKKLADFYAERARGGAGLIISGALQTLYPGRRRDLGKVHLHNDLYIPALKELTGAVHTCGGLIAAQLATYGYWAKSGEGSTPEDVGPSEVYLPVDEVNPNFIHFDFQPRIRDLTVKEIHIIEDHIGEAAMRAKTAGFDAVELQCVAGNLINRFITPYTNRRTDTYGGTLINRLRILLETIATIKSVVGSDYPLICRIPGEDLVPWGLSLDQWAEIAPLIEFAGVHALTLMPGWHESRKPKDQMCVPRGAFVYLAESLKQAVKIPVAAGTQINDPVLAEQILQEGKADLVSMARPLIADPELPNKAKEGRLDDIRMCTFCCNCFDGIHRNEAISCSVNAMAGREGEYSTEPAGKPRNVVVIGGGPAGMESARVAALRGHNVTLFEKEDTLGGLLNYASIPPYKNEWETTIRYLSHQMNKPNIRVNLGQTCTLQIAEELEPDVVIVATGSVQDMPKIRGINGKNVVQALDVLAGRKNVDSNVLVVGGGLIGCETAEFLYKLGKHVTIVEQLPFIGVDMSPRNRWINIDRLVAAGIRMETDAKVTEITEAGVWINRQCGSSEFFEAKSVVIATGMTPLNEVMTGLQNKVSSVYCVGDCVKPRRIKDAIEEGFLRAMQI